MKLGKYRVTIIQLAALSLYYGVVYWLPASYTPPRILGRMIRRFRGAICRRIFLKSGKDINVERKAYFGLGTQIELGDYSSIGVNSHIPPNTKIGAYVMMAPNVYILAANHRFDDINTPMVMQGNTEKRQTVIEDDVWIGRNVTMTPGRHISKGSIIAAGCVLSKDFPPYSIVGGNPSKLIKSRLPQQ